MKINLHNNSTSSRDHMLFVHEYVRELVEVYKMPFNVDACSFFLDDDNGVKIFKDWLLQSKGLDVQPFKLKSKDGTLLAFGFDVEENAALTAELLKFHASK